MAIIQNVFLGSCFLDFLSGLSLHSDKLGTSTREHWGCCPPHGGPNPRPRTELSTPWLYPPGRAPLRGPSVSSAGIAPAPTPLHPSHQEECLTFCPSSTQTPRGLGSVCAAIRVAVSSLTTATQRSRHSPSHHPESRVAAPGLLRPCPSQGRHHPSAQIPGLCAPPGLALAKREAGRGPLSPPPLHQVHWHQVGMSPLSLTHPLMKETLPARIRKIKTLPNAPLGTRTSSPSPAGPQQPIPTESSDSVSVQESESRPDGDGAWTPAPGLAASLQICTSTLPPGWDNPRRPGLSAPDRGVGESPGPFTEKSVLVKRPGCFR